MDLLSQYQQEHPEAFREQPKRQPSDEYGFFIRLILRLSGGRVRDVKTVHKVLLIAAIIIALASMSLWLFAGTRDGTNLRNIYPPGSSAL